MPASTVFIVDDDAAVRNGLRFLLNTAGYEVEAFCSAAAFLEFYEPNRCGCLLLDVQMPAMTGPQLQRQLNIRGWRIPVIFITGHATVPLAIEAIKAGAFDLIEKPVMPEIVLDRIARALAVQDAGDDDRQLRAQLKTSIASLTARQREVLTLVAAGDSSKTIARQLGISFRTVETHRAHLLQKLHARGPSDLVRLAAMVKTLATI